MDLIKSKVYGFPRHYMNYKVYDPTKYRYLKSKQYGYFECPRQLKVPELHYLVNQYKQREEYEKWMNPNGHKLTLTSNFPKIGPTLDFLDPKKFYLVRSEKEYNNNEIKFLVDKEWGKDEIGQFFHKLYRIRPQKIHTAILPGEVKLKPSTKQREYMRTPDRKKAVIQLGFETDDKYREIPSIKEREKQKKYLETMKKNK